MIAQLNFNVTADMGARVWNFESGRWEAGINPSIGIQVYPYHNEDIGIHWYVNVNGSYSSIYDPEVNLTYRFVHTRVGFGLTDAKHVFFTINPGFIKTLDSKAGSVLSFDIEGLLLMPFFYNEDTYSKIQPFLKGGFGGFTSNPFPKTPNKPMVYGQLCVGLLYKIY